MRNELTAHSRHPWGMCRRSFPAVLVTVYLLSATLAGAHQSPAGCTENGLVLFLAKDKTSIVDGETVTYTVTIANDFETGACDVTNATVSVTCPDAGGTPNGTTTVCTSGKTYPGGYPPTLECVVPCVVTVNPGASVAVAKAEVHGVLHDNPLNDLDTADVVLFIAVIVQGCGDGIAVPPETCDPPGSPAGPSGNTCREDCTVCGDGIVNDGEHCDDANTNNNDGCSSTCTAPCSVNITKTVAPDDGSGGGTACDGTADGPFVESVTVDKTSCVVYEICVTNTGQQLLDGNGVKVSDPVLGTVDSDFGTIPVGAPPVCKQAPGVMTAPTCTGGGGASCICQEVEGLNTATISSAICAVTSQDPCTQPGSDCSDTANVACLGAGSCRMTGGHNFDLPVDAEFNEHGKVYTTGGQIGAPNESGCCELPPKGKCVHGTCTGGLNGGQTCTTDEDCPNDPERNSHCPWGDWEHNHHSGPDDSGSVTGGSFAFHSGTAAAPDEAFIQSVLCADPGWCVQARPAPFKQIFWEGIGVFHNEKVAGKDIPLPLFSACENQPIPYSKKSGGTIHYYKAHVGDFGEPAGIFQKPADACEFDELCSRVEPNQAVEIDSCELGDVCLIDQEPREKETLLHPLCQAQQCSECPDLYEIEIHCTADPSSPVAYRVSHFVREGNFQLHPPVGDSCNPGCGHGVCEPGVTGPVIGL